MLFHRAQTEFTTRSESDLQAGDSMKKLLLDNLPNFGRIWDVHLPVFMTAPSLARLLWFNDVYQRALDVPGRVLEFGSQWGASLNVLMLLKIIYEPWNAARPIISFSSFANGFPVVGKQDIPNERTGTGGSARAGDYATSAGWKTQLDNILNIHAAHSPVGAGQNFQIIEGDVRHTFPKWLKENPEALVSHAHFDMDVYEPTHDALQLVLPRMPKGAILIFDEINSPLFPGETRAVQDVLGIHNLALRKSNFHPYAAYCIIE